MSGFSTYLSQAIIGHVLRGQNFPPPAGTYLALFDADPTDDNLTANEFDAAWYARKQVTAWAAPVGAGVATSNSNPVVLDAVVGASLTATHWGLYDALTNGNLLCSYEFTTPIVLDEDDIFEASAGDLVLTFSNFSTHLAQSLINHILRGVAYAMPENVFLALAVADFTKDNVTANEVSGAWYARQDISTWAAPVGVGNDTENSNEISFNAVTDAAVSVTHGGLYDAVAAGNLLVPSALLTPKILNISDVFTVSPGDFDLIFT